MSLRGAYLRQASSDLAVYQALYARPELPACHALHYLQMATEKLAKAVLLATGSRTEADVRASHKALSLLPGVLKGRRSDAQRVDYANPRAFDSFLDGVKSLCRAIDELSPSIGPQQAGGGAADGPNCEYPWFGRGGAAGEHWLAPAEWAFSVERLLKEGNGPGLIPFLQRLLDRFESVFP
jgi:hypothetical protein